MIVMRRRHRFDRSYLAHKIKPRWQAVDVPRRLNEKPRSLNVGDRGFFQGSLDPVGFCQRGSLTARKPLAYLQCGSCREFLSQRIEATMLKIMPMEDPFQRGTVFGERVGAAPFDEAQNFFKCDQFGGWFDARGVEDNEGSLPHPAQHGVQ
jgi:hypothetical protein